MYILFVVMNFNIEKLGIMMLSSILKKSGHTVDVVEMKWNKIKNKLKYHNNYSTVLCYSLHSIVDSYYYIKINYKIKKENPKMLSLFGGPYTTSFPEEIINYDGVDGICIGEGDYALLDLVNNLKEKKTITNIPNWWIKQDGQIFRNPCRPLIDNLDKLPFADRTLFKVSFPVRSISTSRGCIFKCSFCTERGRFRRRSVDNVIAELRELKANYNAKFIYFADSTFNISLPWLKIFLRDIPKR